jgi:hypothetical protein
MSLLLLGATQLITSTEEIVVENGLLGPGPNAPNWSNKQLYTEESFTTVLPTNRQPVNAAGFKNLNGQDGTEVWNGSGYNVLTYTPTRVSYPTVSTPLGTKQVFRGVYPGSTVIINAESQVAEWNATQGGNIWIRDTWSGTLAFEVSNDGGETYSPVTLGGVVLNNATAQTGSSTTVNGLWGFAGGPNRFVRVRALSWASGAARVHIGVSGGEAPFALTAGTIVSNQTRLYTRYLLKIDADWTDNGNTGTKFVFYSKIPGANNHVLMMTARANSTTMLTPQIVIQGHLTALWSGTPTVLFGEWMDIEWEIVANDIGVDNGIARCWVNGTLVLSENQIRHFKADAPNNYLSTLVLDPTYGGGFRPPPGMIGFEIAAWYRETAP